MRYIVILIGCFFCLNSFTQEDVFEKKNNEIIKKNKVKSQTSFNYSITNGVVAATGYKNSYVTYDKSGNYSEQISYKSTGSVFSMESFLYDRYGNDSGYVRFDGSQNKITYKKAFKYDSQGRKLKEVGFDGMSNYRNVYVYLDKTKIASIEYYISDNLSQKRVFEYNGNNLTINVLKNDGKLDFRITQKLDEKGRILEDIEFQPDNKSIKRQYNYKYNTRGDVIEEIKYEYGKLLYKKIFTFDTKANLIKITQEDTDGSNYDLCQFEYDATGKLIKELYRKKKDQQFSSKNYKYDEKGICTEVECFYSSYNYRVLFKYSYEFY